LSSPYLTTTDMADRPPLPLHPFTSRSPSPASTCHLCLTSPNLLPMMARRSSHPSHHPVISHFDYLPTADGLSPASASSSYNTRFEQNLMSSIFPVCIYSSNNVLAV
jgi:hypothetical protein